MHEALLYGHGVERPFLCPVHGDSRPSASLNTVKQVWVCYTCGAKGKLTGEDALIEPDYDTLKAWFDSKLEEQRVYPESWLARYTAGPVHHYWRDRCGEAAARHFHLGYDSDSNAGTYPLRNHSGELLGVVRRNLGEHGPKYLYPTGVDVGRLLFNYDPYHRPSIALVEGALDAVALWRVGVPAFAIYGARLGPEQVRLIDRVDPDRVYTFYDNDDAGWSAYCQTERMLRHRVVTRITWPRSWGKDVGELSENRLRSLVSDDLLCIESDSCRSPESVRKSEPPTTRRSRPTSKPRRLQIVRATT